jgi:hypothetical protein
MSTLAPPRVPARTTPRRRPLLAGSVFAVPGLAAAVLGVNAGQFDGHGITPAQAFIIDQLLLPRVLTALLAGAALALAASPAAPGRTCCPRCCSAPPCWPGRITRAGTRSRAGSCPSASSPARSAAAISSTSSPADADRD